MVAEFVLLMLHLLGIIVLILIVSFELVPGVMSDASIGHGAAITHSNAWECIIVVKWRERERGDIHKLRVERGEEGK